MGKKILLSTCILATIFFAYANLRFVNPSAQLEPIDVMTVDYQAANLSAEGWKEYILSNQYIRACSIDETQRTAGLTYEYRKLDKQSLLRWLSMEGAVQVTQKEFAKPVGPACPVHGVLEWWNRALEIARVVD